MAASEFTDFLRGAPQLEALFRCAGVSSGTKGVENIDIVVWQLPSPVASASGWRTNEDKPAPEWTMLNLDPAYGYSQLRPSSHIYPVQRKLFSTLFWEKESGEKEVFNAVQIMKNVSGKNLFLITTVVHCTLC